MSCNAARSAHAEVIEQRRRQANLGYHPSREKRRIASTCGVMSDQSARFPLMRLSAMEARRTNPRRVALLSRRGALQAAP
jgi:hypothetical protein